MRAAVVDAEQDACATRVTRARREALAHAGVRVYGNGETAESEDEEYEESERRLSEAEVRMRNLAARS